MQNVYASVRSLDQLARSRFGLTEDIMTENAASALEIVVKEILDSSSRTSGFCTGSGGQGEVRVLIISGSGDNGGDGMALARRLCCGEFSVAVYPVLEPRSESCKRQYELAQKCGVHFTESLIPCSLVVDCLFGSGFHGPLSPEIRQLIEKINGLDCSRLSCDIPSGLDASGNSCGSVFQAQITLCMGALKTALFSDEARDYTGEIRVADLGVSRFRYEGQEGAPEAVVTLLEKSDLRLPSRTRQNVHKGTFGHCGVVSGEKEGAAILCALAAYGFGAGLVTLVGNKVSSSVPWEIMMGKTFPENLTAVACGMGLSRPSKELTDFLLSRPELPCVLDAGMFSRKEIKILLNQRPGGLVLTPHPKEFASLLDICGLGTYDPAAVTARRLDLTREFCSRYPKTVLLLKGASPLICCNSRIFVNPNGACNLAKGGSGDVLSGLIAALLAQGQTPFEAAIQGSLAHGIAASKVPLTYGLTPEVLIDAVKKLENP